MKQLWMIPIKVLLICLLIMWTSPGYAQGARGVTDDSIKIGVIMDQTGVASPVTVPVTNATRTYFKFVNDQGGINGRKVDIIVEDDRYTIPGAFAAFKKLIFKDKVLSILYTGGTGQTMALRGQIKKNGVPVIPISLAESMTTPLKKYIFTPSSSYDDGLKVIADYIIKDLKVKRPRIAFIYPDVEFGKNGLRATEKYLGNYNVKLTSKVVINLSDIDATSQVLTLKKINPEYIILHDAVAGLISFYKAAKKYGLQSKVLGSFYVSDEDNIGATGDTMKDTLAVSPLGFWTDDTPGMNRLRKITKNYRPETKNMTRSYTQGWVTSIICAEGLRRAGKNLTPETLVEAYETFKNFQTGEISGPVSYSKTNHKAGRTNKLYKVDVERRTFIPVTDFREPAIQD